MPQRVVQTGDGEMCIGRQRRDTIAGRSAQKHQLVLPERQSVLGPGGVERFELS